MFFFYNYTIVILKKSVNTKFNQKNVKELLFYTTASKAGKERINPILDKYQKNLFFLRKINGWEDYI